MSPELITAIKERIALGRSREEIEAEVVATGYTTEQFAAAYAAATTPSSATTTSGLAPDTTYYARTTPGTLISTGDLVGKMWDLMKEQKGILGKTIGVSFLILLAVAALGALLFFVVGEASSSLAWLVLGYFILMVGYSFLYAGMIRALLRRQAPTPTDRTYQMDITTYRYLICRWSNGTGSHVHWFSLPYNSWLFVRNVLIYDG